MTGRGFNLDDYEPVADRVERFWKDHQDGRILTDLVYRDGQSFIVKASVWRELGPELPDSTGYAEEIIGSTNVNRTSALENCETSAIGRALANLGYAVKNRASREEMVKATASDAAAAPPETELIRRRSNKFKAQIHRAVGGDDGKGRAAWAEILALHGIGPGDAPDSMEVLDAIEADVIRRVAEIGAGAAKR